MKIGDLFEHLVDKRFSLKFRILNILSNDALRNYLAVGVGLNLSNAAGFADYEGAYPEKQLYLVRKRIEKAQGSLNKIWYI